MKNPLIAILIVIILVLSACSFYQKTDTYKITARVDKQERVINNSPPPKQRREKVNQEPIKPYITIKNSDIGWNIQKENIKLSSGENHYDIENFVPIEISPIEKLYDGIRDGNITSLKLKSIRKNKNFTYKNCKVIANTFTQRNRIVCNNGVRGGYAYFVIDFVNKTVEGEFSYQFDRDFIYLKNEKGYIYTIKSK